MKTITKTIALLSLALITGFTSVASETKIPKKIAPKTVKINTENFYNYLKNGNPTPLEGLYCSDDCRYKILLVKNDAETHDYLGVVLHADNEYWQENTTKFNFVFEKGELKGYYYNAEGKAIPISLLVKEENPSVAGLKKLPIDSLIQ